MKKVKKNILIIGGTGFIGYHLCKKFIIKKWNVTSISLNFPKKKRFVKKVNYIKCDITKNKNLKKKIKNQYDYVINLGGYVDHSNKKKTYNSHYIGAKNIINFFLNKKIKLFIQVGSSAENAKIKSPQGESINGRPSGIYGRSKLKISKFLKKKKFFNFVIFRLYQIYGPEQDENRFLPILINSCLKKKFLYCSSGLKYRDFLYIDYILDAFIKALDNKKIIGKIINIGFGKPLQLLNVINLVKKEIGFLDAKFGKIKLRKDEAKQIYPNIKKANLLLKWKPRTSFNKGLSKTIKSYVNFYNNIASVQKLN